MTPLEKLKALQDNLLRAQLQRGMPLVPTVVMPDTDAHKASAALNAKAKEGLG